MNAPPGFPVDPYKNGSEPLAGSSDPNLLERQVEANAHCGSPDRANEDVNAALTVEMPGTVEPAMEEKPRQAAQDRRPSAGYDGPPDQLLLKRWRSGDDGGFHALMSKYERPMFRVIWKIVRNEDDVRDILQETFLRLWRNLDKIREDVPLHPWLFRAATNLAIDHLRKHKPGRVVSMVDQNSEGVEMTMEPEDQGADPRISARIREIEKHVRQAIDELPKRQRKAMALRGLDDLSLKEIADILECEERTVGTTLFAARKKLMHRLRPLLEELQELAGGPAGAAEVES